MVAGDGFFSNFLESLDSFGCSWYSGIWEDMGECSWFISHHEEEWGCISGIVLSMVMDEFSDWEVFNPIFGVWPAIDAEIGFQFLVQSFCLPICLWVIGC
jgi:hypothetical protein